MENDELLIELGEKMKKGQILLSGKVESGDLFLVLESDKEELKTKIPTDLIAYWENEKQRQIDLGLENHNCKQHEKEH